MRNKLLFLVLFAPIAAVAEPFAALEKADKSYQAGNYSEAVAAYRQALREGLDNGHVHYNLGNAYYRAKLYGRAIAEYRKALLQLPGDPDVRANLELARKQAKDSIDPGGSARGSALLGILPHVTGRMFERLFLTAYLAGWAALISYVLFRGTLARSAGIALLLVSAPLGTLSFGTRHGRDGSLEFALTSEARSLHPGVVTAEESKVYSGDGENYQVVFLLHEGAEIMTGELRGDWLEVLLPDGRKGWMKAEDIEQIKTGDSR